MANAALGKLSWKLDGDQLLKLSPGNLDVTIADPDGMVRYWLQSYTSTTSGGKVQVFPPWVLLKIDDVPRFLGTLDLPSLEWDAKTYYVRISADDWSSQLSDITLDGDEWKRRQPKIISTTQEVVVGLGGYWSSVIFIPDAIRFDTTNLGIAVGDVLRNSLDSTLYKVTSFVVKPEDPPAGRTYVAVTPWINWHGTNIATWTKVVSPVADQPYHVTTAAVASGATAIPLDVVDQLYVGDELQSVSGLKLTIAEIDPERKEVISTEALSEGLPLGTALYLSEESQKQLVLEDALQLLARAAWPYPVDASGVAPVTLSRPIMGWLPLRNRNTDIDLRCVYDIEPTLTGVRLLGSDRMAWSGTPEAGYTQSRDGNVRNVDWTCQKATAPARLMPDNSPDLIPYGDLRYRVYGDWSYKRPKLIDGNWDPTTPVFDLDRDGVPVQCVAHDYSQFRRVLFYQDGYNRTAWKEQVWSGSAWSTGTTGTYSLSTWKPCSAVPMIGVSATSGPTPYGQAILVLASSSNWGSTTWELQLMWAGGSLVRLSVPAERVRGARLRTTPYGVYLVGPTGYGRISYSSGALTLNWQDVKSGQASLLPNTLVALDADNFFTFAAITYKNDQGEDQVETHLFQLLADPQNGAAPLVWSERVSSGTPRTLAVVRDPSKAGRILGVYGGRYFQIHSTFPATVERVDPSSMTGQELVEHICQLLNAIAIPRPDGVLQVVSRTSSGDIQSLYVDETATSEKWSEHFFAVVRVSGKEDDIYADATDPEVRGGTALELDSQPLIWSEGACFGLAASLMAFFGKPRKEQSRTWIWPDADAAPSWENVATPWARVQINDDDTSSWIVTGLEEDLIRGEAKVTLLENV